MKAYHALSHIKFLKRYSHKFLFVAFVGIHIPLLGILVYVLISTNTSPLNLVMVILGLTLAATGATLYVLNSLLSPINEGRRALSEFVEKNTVPQLPTIYTDEVGEMLKNIQHTVERLHHMLTEKEDIISLISHDLRTPVNQIAGLLELLEDEENVMKRAESTSLIRQIVERQKVFLDYMLKILQSREVELDPSNFEILNLSLLMDEVIAENSEWVKSKEVIIEMEIAPDLAIKGHQVAFKEVLANLINNAIKFSYSNGVIRISGFEDKEEIALVIKDAGKGFSKKDLEGMFKRFVPGQPGTNDEPSTGIGLYLVNKVIEGHKGKIEATSKGQGLGAVFTLRLPCPTD